MSYFHVLLAAVGSPDDFKCVWHDLTEPELKATVLRPYRAGTSLRSGARIYPTQEIRGLRIIRTEKPAQESINLIEAQKEEHRRAFNADPNSGVFLMPSLGGGIDDIAEAGLDVTEEFIRQAPGEGGVVKLLAPITNHPWISGVGTAVLASAVAKWLGLV